MSANAYYSTQRKGIYIEGDVNDYIRRMMQKNGLSQLVVTPQDSIYQYFKGLNDANVKGAKELLEKVDDKGCIEIWLEY